MSHLFAEIFELLFELIEFLEPYLLVTTIFFIPFTISVTSLPKQFFRSEFTQNLFPNLFLAYERKKLTFEWINSTTQMLMFVILLIDLFGLVHFFVGSNEGEHSAEQHNTTNEHEPVSAHGAETE